MDAFKIRLRWWWHSDVLHHDDRVSQVPAAGNGSFWCTWRCSCGASSAWLLRPKREVEQP